MARATENSEASVKAKRGGAVGEGEGEGTGMRRQKEKGPRSGGQCCHQGGGRGQLAG